MQNTYWQEDYWVESKAWEASWSICNAAQHITTCGFAGLPQRRKPLSRKAAWKGEAFTLFVKNHQKSTHSHHDVMLWQDEVPKMYCPCGLCLPTSCWFQERARRFCVARGVPPAAFPTLWRQVAVRPIAPMEVELCNSLQWHWCARKCAELENMPWYSECDVMCSECCSMLQQILLLQLDLRHWHPWKLQQLSSWQRTGSLQWLAPTLMSNLILLSRSTAIVNKCWATRMDVAVSRTSWASMQRALRTSAWHTNKNVWPQSRSRAKKNDSWLQISKKVKHVVALCPRLKCSAFHTRIDSECCRSTPQDCLAFDSWNYDSIFIVFFLLPSFLIWFWRIQVQCASHSAALGRSGGLKTPCSNCTRSSTRRCRSYSTSFSLRMFRSTRRR